MSHPIRDPKIKDASEVESWFAQGHTYAWMSEEYERRYNVTAGRAVWEEFRRARGLEMPFRPVEALPWIVRAEHRWSLEHAMLRMDRRLSTGARVHPDDVQRWRRWRKHLELGGLVIGYDPDSPDGFYRTPARPGIDADLIRTPDGDA